MEKEYKAFIKKFPLNKTDFSEQSRELFDYLYGIFSDREQRIHKEGYTKGLKAKL